HTPLHPLRRASKLIQCGPARLARKSEMTADSFARSLRAFCHRQPFTPFMVELVSGTVWRITHPEALSLRSEVVIYTQPVGTQLLHDETTVAQRYDVARTPDAAEEW